MVSNRRFFVALGILCALICVAGFGPNLYRFFTGQIYIPSIVHVHATVMMTWVVLYTAQGALASRGSMRMHRRLGIAGLVLAATVWLSMAVATVEALQRYDPAKMSFLVQPLLIQLGTMVVFAVYVVWAVLQRRNELWHQRLMAFATFSLVQAALDRMHWLPNEGLPMFWHHGLRLYLVLVLPLAIFDVVTLKRIHPATLLGTGVIVSMHAVISYCWENEAWKQLALTLWHWLQR